MYEDFFGLREKPFSLLPDPSFLYLSRSHKMALTMLEYSLLNESAGICVISGEIGSGKTTLIRKLLNIMENHYTVGLLSNIQNDHDNLLQWVSMAYGLEHRDLDKIDLFDNFNKFTIDQYAKGKRTILIIDEAQNLSHHALEELRMLTNINADKDQVLQLILVGQPELRSTFRIEKLEQLNQRVTASYHLSELNQKDCCDYIKHRLKLAGGTTQLFTDSACKAVWYHSRGIPRIINTLCDTAMVYAFAEHKKQVDVQQINNVVNDRKVNGFFTKGQEISQNVTRIDCEPKTSQNM